MLDELVVKKLYAGDTKSFLKRLHGCNSSLILDIQMASKMDIKMFNV